MHYYPEFLKFLSMFYMREMHLFILIGTTKKGELCTVTFCTTEYKVVKKLLITNDY